MSEVNILEELSATKASCYEILTYIYQYVATVDHGTKLNHQNDTMSVNRLYLDTTMVRSVTSVTILEKKLSDFILGK